ncbi:MAG: hypothetical protein R6U50_02625 [Desulfobacterales bacterium]
MNRNTQSKTFSSILQTPFLKGGIGAMDQALTAFTHFLLTIMVARSLGAVALGEFASAYAILVMAQMTHSAILAESYSVIDLRNCGTRKGQATILLSISIFGSILILALLLFLYYICRLNVLRIAVSPSFLTALTLSSLFWVARPLLYRHDRVISSFLITAVYSLTLITSIFLAHSIFDYPFSPFWFIALGAFTAAISLLCIVFPARISFIEGRFFVKSVFQYGKWGFPAAIAIWIVNNGYFILMPIFRSYEDVAGLKAVLNFLFPLNHVINGAVLWILPWLASFLRNNKVYHFHGQIRIIVFLSFGLAFLFSLPVIVLSNHLLVAFYGDFFGKYATSLTCAAFFLPVLWSITAVFRAAIRAMSLPNKVFRAYATALLPVGAIMMVYGSTHGPLASVFGIIITQFIIFVWFWKNYFLELRNLQAFAK